MNSITITNIISILLLILALIFQVLDMMTLGGF